MRIRLRAPNGQHTVEVENDATLGALREKIAQATGVPEDAQELLTGFPPKVLSGRDAEQASALGVSNGETITVRQSASAPSAPASPAPSISAPTAVAEAPAAPSSFAAAAAADAMDEDEALARAIAASMADAGAGAPPPPPPSAAQPAAPPRAPEPSVQANGGDDGTVAVRRVIDSDNSCLFNAVGYVMERSLSQAPKLRKVIADTVASDPITYSEAFLAKPNAEYCRWITDPKHWGGAVELSILSKYYGREIAAYDIQTQRCDVYGQGEGYSERVMLLYDGLHYDAMALSAYEGAPGDIDITIVPAAGAGADAADSKARRVVGQAHASRQFTDTANFTLRCLVCQKGLKGEKEAVEHAKQTGHQNFGEY